MKRSKLYKYAALAGLFIFVTLVSYWFFSTGLPQRYLGDEVGPAAVIIGSLTGLYAAYLTKKKNQSSDC